MALATRCILRRNSRATKSMKWVTRLWPPLHLSDFKLPSSVGFLYPSLPWRHLLEQQNKQHIWPNLSPKIIGDRSCQAFYLPNCLTVRPEIKCRVYVACSVAWALASTSPQDIWHKTPGSNGAAFDTCAPGSHRSLQGTTCSNDDKGQSCLSNWNTASQCLILSLVVSVPSKDA